jgi:hypothetical protein
MDALGAGERLSRGNSKEGGRNEQAVGGSGESPNLDLIYIYIKMGCSQCKENFCSSVVVTDA